VDIGGGRVSGGVASCVLVGWAEVRFCWSSAASGPVGTGCVRVAAVTCCVGGTSVRTFRLFACTVLASGS